MSDEEIISRTEDEQKRALQIFDSFRDDLNKRELSNSENYDKTILTLSSTGLAISLSFLKFIVPPDKASSLWMLKVGWVFFLLSVIISLVAYIVSNKAIKRQLEIAEEYYVDGKASAQNRKNSLSEINNILNIIVGILFAFALVLIVLFVNINVTKEEHLVSEKKSKAPVVQKNVRINESAPLPRMQKAPGQVVERSANVPSVQSAPGTVAPAVKPAAKPAPAPPSSEGKNTE